MDNPIFTFISLIFPVLMSIVLFSLIFCLQKNGSNPYLFKVSLPLFISFDAPIRFYLPSIIIIIFLSLTSLLFPAFRDYSPFFPTYLKMQVFFDDEGILRSLNHFNPRELEIFKIKNNWQSDKAEYISDLNKLLRDVTGTKFRFDFAKRNVASEGSTTFVTKKISKWGLQKYRIQEAHGNLTHSLLSDSASSHVVYQSIFRIRKTGANYIDLGFYDIYIGYTFVISPEFDQLFTLTNGEEIYNHHLTAMTKIRMFPYIDIGNTVYLLRRTDGNSVPIGYAIYTPQ
ncbi:MAG: hypothetical protein ACYDH2_05425 [Anaerolineaceae bacterium]